MTPPASVKLQFSPLIRKQIKKLRHQQPKILKKLYQQLELFQIDHNHPKLKTHKLKGSLKNAFAFSITHKLRIIFKWKNSRTIILISIGSHDQVYH